jgi:hypothetical protein
MDQGRLLDGVASMSYLGDLADDVVLACSAIRRTGKTQTGSAKQSLERGLLLVQALGQFERPLADFTSSVSAMSEAEAASDAVQMLTLSLSRPGGEFLTELAGDLQSVASGDAQEERLERVITFFTQLAISSLSSANSLVRPIVSDAEWTNTAPIF